MDLRSSLNTSLSSPEFFPPVQPDDPHLQLLAEITPQEFTTSQGLRKSLERRRQALQEDRTRDQYIAFTSVPQAQSAKLSDDRSQSSKYCRFFFNTATGTLIAKIMPHPAHEAMIREFDYLILADLCAMNVRRDLLPLGSTTTTIGNWTKEADSSWTPSLTSLKLSFVVEIGLSESARHLALDTHGWLEANSSSIKVVVTISIRHDHPEIIFNRWELTDREGPSTRSHSLSAHRTAVLKLSRQNNTTTITGEAHTVGTTTTTTQLTLPFDKIMGRPPSQALERDLVISAQELKCLAETIWTVQRLI